MISNSLDDWFHVERPREKRIQAGIVKDLKTLGFMVNDLSQPRATMLPLGLPDLFVCHEKYGAWWIEVKTPKGKLSRHQEAWHATALSCGVRVIVARSSAEALQQMGVTGL